MATKLPNDEKVWRSYYNAKNELMFVLTSKGRFRELYFLYRVQDGQYTKLGEGTCPPDLENEFSVLETVALTKTKSKK